MTQQEDSYWLHLAVEAFSANVWHRGLSKFSLDKEVGDHPETFSYSSYSLTINRPTEDKVNITLENPAGDEPELTVLFYFTEDPYKYPQVTIWEISTSTDLLETVTQLWAEGVFVKKE